MFERFYKDMKKYYRYSIVSAKSQLKSEVANSYLNWIWWILEPFCFMLIYSYMFGYVFNAKEQYFPAYIFIGLTMWNFFNKTVHGSVKIIKANKSVISKVYFPKYILILTKIWVNGFKMLISFGIVVLMMLFFQIPVNVNLLFCIPVLFILVLFTFACSCILLHFGVYVEDLSNVMNIGLKMLFYITGVFYNLEKRIPEFGAIFNSYNPMAFLLTSMRKCLIYKETPDLKFLAIWFAVSVVLAIVGVHKIYKEENSYVKAI